ncbi:MAG: hypothetical protein EZS28_051249, partial [Streblomastix strix]
MYQLHYCRIETCEQTYIYCYSDGINCTTVELKRRMEQYRTTSFPSINCTTVELKRDKMMLRAQTRLCINCTTVELKPKQYNPWKRGGSSINCTTVELKHTRQLDGQYPFIGIETPWRQLFGGFRGTYQLHYCRIETSLIEWFSLARIRINCTTVELKLLNDYDIKVVRQSINCTTVELKP